MTTVRGHVRPTVSRPVQPRWDGRMIEVIEPAGAPGGVTGVGRASPRRPHEGGPVGEPVGGPLGGPAGGPGGRVGPYRAGRGGPVTGRGSGMRDVGPTGGPGTGRR